ncbi:uncharacterized protein LOC144103531 [Amblyomma americanum]
MVCLLISPPRRGMGRTMPAVRLDGARLSFRPAVKVLGVVFDRTLSFIPHAERLKERAETLSARLATFFRISGTPAPARLRALYRQVVLPTLAYASPVWWTASPHSGLCSRLFSVQRSPLLVLAGAYSTTSTRALQILLHAPPLAIDLDRLNAEFDLFSRRQDVAFGTRSFRAVEVEEAFLISDRHPSEVVAFEHRQLYVDAAAAAALLPAHHIYTDGSYTSVSAGAAFVAFGVRGDLRAVGRFRAEGASPYAVELVAFAEAITFARPHVRGRVLGVPSLLSPHKGYINIRLCRGRVLEAP